MKGVKVLVEKNKEVKDDEYPCYKTTINGDGLIVLFTSKQKGVVVVEGTNWKEGHCASNWAESEFIPFHGKITIEVE